MGKRRVISIKGSEKEGILKTTASGAKKKTGKKKNILKGQVHIQATYNNTIITLTDLNGGVLSWASGGLLGFKGAKKSTPYAASLIVKTAIEKTKKMGLKDVDVFVKGIGSGRESAIRAIVSNGLNVGSIADVTPIPHNGCRPRKRRRV